MSTIDFAIAGDNSVAKKLLFLQAKICAAVDNKWVQLFKTAWVEEKLNPFPGGELSSFVLSFNALGAAPGCGLLSQSAQFGDLVFNSHFTFPLTQFVGYAAWRDLPSARILAYSRRYWLGSVLVEYLGGTLTGKSQALSTKPPRQKYQAVNTKP
ncbi:hypothetical protein ES703_113016 [subsurface metagenome]